MPTETDRPGSWERQNSPKPARLHQAADGFENWHIGRIVTVVSQFGIILAVIAFAIELSDRTEERTVRAWQLVTTQACGNSGKIAALEYLNEDSRPFESIPTKW